MLNELFHIQERNLSSITMDFKRYLHNEINWDNRLAIITGARGTGKTFLVLQHFLERYNDIKKSIGTERRNIQYRGGILQILWRLPDGG